jgi:putative methanogen marker protein 4
MNLLEEIQRPPDLTGIKVGVGALSANDSVIRLSAEDAERMGIEVTIYTNPEDLIDALVEKRIDAAARGTLDSATTLAVIRDRFQIEHVMRVAYMRSAFEKPFFLAPVGVDDCPSYTEKEELLEYIQKYSKVFNIFPRIGVLSAGRISDESKLPEIERSIEEARRLVKKAQEMGLSARFYEILIEDAIKSSNIIISPDGVSGNLIFRTLYYLGAGDSYGAPVININRVFVDTSRGKSDYTSAIQLAAILANRARRHAEAREREGEQAVPAGADD